MAATPPKTTKTTKQTTKRTTSKPRAGAPSAKQPPTVIRRIGADLYWVSSASHPGQGHQTTPRTCTCPASRYGRPDCRHQALVRAYHAWREQQVAAPAAPTRVQQRAEPVELSSYFE